MSQENHDAAIKEKEDEYFNRRREHLKECLPTGGPDFQLDRPSVGLALSGGGIRSATFALGVLKGLSKLERIHWIDYLSTVSGGGYTGAFYASLFTGWQERGAAVGPSESPCATRDPLGSADGRAAIRHLRDNGRYLLDSGGDAFRLAVIAIRGWLAIQLVIGITLLAIFLTSDAVQRALLQSEFLKDWNLALAKAGWSSWFWPREWLLGWPVGDMLLFSALWPLVGLALALATATMWAYWLARYHTPRSRVVRIVAGPATFTAVIALVCLLTLLDRSPGDADFEKVKLFICALAVGAVLLYSAAELIGFFADPKPVPALSGNGGPVASMPREEEDRVRHRLTSWSKNCLLAATFFGVIALVDTVGQSIYAAYLQDGVDPSGRRALAGGAILAVLIPLVRQVITWAQGLKAPGAILRRFGRLIALVVALMLALVLASFWAVVAEFIAWRGGPVGGERLLSLASPIPGWDTSTVWWSALTFACIAAAIGMSIGFLNLSSLSGFYSGRLRRAYLGASNPGRWPRAQEPGKRRSRADEEDPGDDVRLSDYYMLDTGAPLHLINVTVNETRGDGSNLVRRDRKGRPLTLSPAGHLFATGETTRQFIPFRRDPNEPYSADADLPLSTWMAISGAALSTGLGQNTSVGLALLAGLANLRLGQWWAPRKKSFLLNPREWTQVYLVREFLARFSVEDKNNRWYLTDGGHFENTGVYELVRRRVRLIIASDAGADPDYDFGDIVNLTRKLRIDFDAELEFLPASRLDDLLGTTTPNRRIFGELSELVARSREHSSQGPYAAIGRIRIAADHARGTEAYSGTLILLKPRLGGLEMADLLDYHRVNPEFPQQSTGDQIFDEAQWESYFRLGTTITELVFAEPARIDDYPRQRLSWSPHALLPIETADFSWFDDELLSAAPRKEKPAAPAAAPAAPAAAATSAAGSFGSGRLLAGGIAALAAFGVAGGAGQSLVTRLVGPPAAPAASGAVELTLNQGDRDLLSSGIGANIDSRSTQVFTAIVARLGELSEAAREEPAVPGKPCLCDQLGDLRTLLIRFINRPDPGSLEPLVKQVGLLRDELRTQNAQVVKLLQDGDKARLEQILATLEQLGKQVEASSPRRNNRGQ